MAHSFLAPPKAPPALNIPKQGRAVKLSIIDSTTFIKLPMSPFFEPDYKGKDFLAIPAFAFLIEHDSGQKVLFDLATRKDWENLPPALVQKFKAKKWEISVKQDVAEILQENGVDVKGGAITDVIWSHHHWDHIGNLTTFPNSTSLVVGPGFKDAFLPGYPTRKDSPLLQHDFENREVSEVDFAASGEELRIGRFRAHDYFGDGSFYLLDTPGHSIGHICGLARTTEDSFVFMGGDASHHGGEFRPSEYLPLPTEIDPSPISTMSVCPGHLCQDIHRTQNPAVPYYLVKEALAHDLDVCNWTIHGLQEFDADERVFMLIAHDNSVLPYLDFYPKTMNDWKTKELAKRVRWTFLADFHEAFDEAVQRRR